ncbi:Amino acid/polyamine transporter I [Penicillium expansum]|nr:Amino acid/polyamine transporter I [Penicillium expansum]
MQHSRTKNDVSFGSLLEYSEELFSPTWPARIFPKPCLAPTSIPRFNPGNSVASFGFSPDTCFFWLQPFLLVSIGGALVAGRFYTSHPRSFERRVARRYSRSVTRAIMTVFSRSRPDSQQTMTGLDEEYAQKGLVEPRYMGTLADRRDMNALGRVQVLRRNFRFVSIVGFGCTLICTWEVILTLLAAGLTDGGTAGLIWGFVGVTIGFTLVYASIAEMASMAPTAGGQYHWVSEFAPKRGQKYLSYITGWLSAMGWQCAIVSIAYLAGTIIQGLIVLNQPDYDFQRWHGTMLVIAISTFSILFNTFLAKNLPFVEGLILIIHIVGVFAIIIPLWVLAPRNNAKAVFTTFNNGGGWDSSGTATLVGLSTTITSMLGYDCSVHMSEEIKDASETLPKAMMTSVAVNGVLGFIMLVTLCFTLGEVDSVLDTPTRFPFIQIFYNTTGSFAATNAMTAVLVVTLTASTITEVATASRQLWSFARDEGLPFSLEHSTQLRDGVSDHHSATVDDQHRVGGRSERGHFTHHNVPVVRVYHLYRVRIPKTGPGETLPHHRWSLGKFGMAVNIGALAFLCPLYVFAFFPLTTKVTVETMNWSVAMYVGIVGSATIYYFVRGKHHFIPPVALVQRDANS